ncbi:MAG: hypothetical protein BHW25_05655 [Faecalibacterium sp. CAG:82-related_59_9]|nr:MAG: hypothetical protein BHW25_05655 [Faecalibacterium sp. CAG:82-related_59_9]
MTELERKIKAKIPGPDTGIEVRHTICDICSPGMHCGINAYIKDGKVIKIEGIDGHPSNDGRLCTKGLSNRQYIYREDRLLTPLKRVGKRGEGKFEPITWDEAYAEIAKGLNAAKAKYGAESVAFYSGYSKWYRQMLRRLAYAFGSPNYGCESSACYTAAFMAAYPNICLEYLDTSARKCEELLEEEQVDLAIYTDPILSSKLEYMPLEEDPLVFVIPQSSPLLAGLDLSGNSLEHPVEIESRRFRDPSLRYILATPGQGLYYAENAFFKKYRVTPLDPLRVEYVDTRYSVVQSGCGIALFPHTTVIQHSHGNSQPPLYGIPKGDALYRYIIIARKKGRTLSPDAEAVWRFMVNQRLEANHHLESTP